MGSSGPSVSECSARPKLNVADFMMSKRRGEVLLKLPGELNGQQFIIEECEDCDIFLLDWSATVTIDLCRRCRIFVGPCESSVFLRDCEDIKAVIACQQLRTRDVHRLAGDGRADRRRVRVLRRRGRRVERADGRVGLVRWADELCARALRHRARL